MKYNRIIGLSSQTFRVPNHLKDSIKDISMSTKSQVVIQLSVISVIAFVRPEWHFRLNRRWRVFASFVGDYTTKHRMKNGFSCETLWHLIIVLHVVPSLIRILRFIGILGCRVRFLQTIFLFWFIRWLYFEPTIIGVWKACIRLV